MLVIHSSIHLPKPSTYLIIQVPPNFKALLRTQMFLQLGGT